MFVSGKCPCCGEQIVSEIIIEVLEALECKTEEDVNEFIFNNVFVKRRMSMEEFITEIRPVLNTYVKKNGMDNGREFMMKTVGVSASTTEETLQAIHRHHLGEMKKAPVKLRK